MSSAQLYPCEMIDGLEGPAGVRGKPHHGEGVEYVGNFGSGLST